MTFDDREPPLTLLAVCAGDTALVLGIVVHATLDALGLTDVRVLFGAVLPTSIVAYLLAWPLARRVLDLP